MLRNLWNRFNSAPVAVAPKPKERPRQVFSTNDLPHIAMRDAIAERMAATFDKSLTPYTAQHGMDSAANIKANFANPNVVPESQMFWYAAQSFIGYQLAAMMSQHWLINKACTMPARDAIRNGYEVTVNDGTDVDPKILDEIRRADVRYNLNRNLREFVRLGRVFGIRVAMFQVESSDPQYYINPFNPDGIKPGSYKGISQIDPYWITPQLSDRAAGNPSAIDFYEPTWWNINGQLVHRTHLVIFRTEEVPDILKPSYIYGGVPIPQKIYERVYAADRTANEAPLLAMTKRTDIMKTDLAEALANEGEFTKRIQQWVSLRDNYGIKIIDRDDDMLQFDTALADLDAVIMTQYQLVAAAANVPAVKLLGTSPKGFNTTGEFEEASYHEELESIQTHDLTPFIERHHLLLIRSEIAPKFGVEPFDTSVTWKTLDAMTAKEQAELNKLKADTGSVLMNSGAIDGNDERHRIINDPESGYTGLEEEETDDKPDVLNDPEGE